MVRSRSQTAAVLVLALLAVPAFPTVAGAQSRPAAEVSKTDEARQRYERGLKLYEEGAFDGARSEFERAYALAATYKLLYNIGVVYAQLADFVGAIKFLEQYLQEGGAQIPEARRNEVTKLLSELRSRVAKLQVRVNEPDSDVYIDDVLVGRSPLAESVAVNPGRRKVSATKKGRVPSSKVIDVASADRANVELELAAVPVVREIRDAPTRRVPWLGWAATGVLAAGAGVFGYVAVTQSSKLKDERAVPNPDADLLASRSSQTKTYGYLADGLAVGALVVGVVSLYYTIKWGKPAATAPTTGHNLTVTPTLGGGMLTF
jgi:hypothetical protein